MNGVAAEGNGPLLSKTAGLAAAAPSLGSELRDGGSHQNHPGNLAKEQALSGGPGDSNKAAVLYYTAGSPVSPLLALWSS
jgi:hypothetical protein